VGQITALPFADLI